MTTEKKLGWVGIILGIIGIIVTLIETELRVLLGIDKNFRIFIAILLFLALVLIIFAWRPKQNVNITQNINAEKEAERRHKLAERRYEIIGESIEIILMITFWVVVLGLLGLFFYFMQKN